MGAEALDVSARKIGHYVLEANAGTGGLGSVFRAYDSRLHRFVAIKVLHEDLRHGTGWDQVLAEARAASALNHPNICTIYEVGEAEGQAYIAMEFVDGKALGQMIPSGGLPVEASLRYAAQIADALAHGHQKGVCHGDLTTSNIMVDRSDRIKLLDFGLAQRFAVPDSPLPGAENIGKGRFAVLADIERFGAVLYEMATGMLPVSRESLNLNLSRITPVLRVPIHRSVNAGAAGGYEAISEARDDLLSSLSPSARDLLKATRAAEAKKAKLKPSWRLFGWVAAAVAGAVLLVGLEVHKGRLNSRGGSQQAAISGSVAHASMSSQADPNIRVWANTKTKIFHCPDTRWYGKTKNGQFMTQAQAQEQGYKAEGGRVCRK
jgi:serine/threonine protein kinase